MVTVDGDSDSCGRVVEPTGRIVVVGVVVIVVVEVVVEVLLIIVV